MMSFTWSFLSENENWQLDETNNERLLEAIYYQKTKKRNEPSILAFRFLAFSR